ncbi:NAD(P)-binding domain-containing protein [Parendozoicomonas haliclonae]|uniref:Pyridine nucleotide-disulfide oxidoreductase n=1 Tax=Parendozoicomonas haliclonae TaxID=1960125 RepID=A0A1X7AG05_9GAMM|nr:NAD(P)-binding domain-containing protein [Parendozoicomonas haliclonae]SMA37503.1 Pyridine nucleotide-disulfide oxidoreductase [Parendozoicomonas haliclonae]
MQVGGSSQTTQFSLLTASDAAPPRVTAVVVGKGPIGLFCHEQLQGLEFVHSGSCAVPFHSWIERGQRLYQTEVFDAMELTKRGLYYCGNWFDSFCFSEFNEPSLCLLPQRNEDRKVDTLLIGLTPVGGSWTSYHSEQKTVSPLTYVGLPHHSIVSWYQNKKLGYDPQKKREKISAPDLCQYYRECYPASESGSLNARVCRATRLRNEEWLLDLSLAQPSGEVISQQVQCRYLVMACGKNNPRFLGIPGEKDNSVVHTSRDAREWLLKADKPLQVLVIGKGLSAVDVISCAMNAKLQHQVTHVIPPAGSYPKRMHSSSGVLDRIKDQGDEYPDHAKVWQYIHYPEAAPPGYRQMRDVRLQSIQEQEHTLRMASGEESTEQFDLTAILIGSDSDFPELYLQQDFGDQLLRDDMQAVSEELDICTMESLHKNLFFIGMCTGEPFQRFGNGHGMAVAETIKTREYDQPVSKDQTQ